MTAAVVGVTPAPAPAATHHHRHFDPTSVSAVSHLDWWVLGRRHIAHTTDGGDTFSETRIHPRYIAGRGEPQVHFADASVGYLFGKRLLVSHDAGMTWRHINVGGHVHAVVSAGGYTYATVGGRLHSVIKRSPVSTDTWTTLPTPGKEPTVKWADSSYLYAVACLRHTREGCQRLLVSADHGATWARHHLPIEDLSCEVQQVGSPVLWEHCATGMMSNVWRSRHNGAHFYAPARQEGLGAAMTNGAAFAAASNRTSLIGSFELRRTTNAGRTWHQVGPKPNQRAGWDSITFSDSRHGFAIRATSRHSQLWRTHDAGAHWHRIRLG